MTRNKRKNQQRQEKQQQKQKDEPQYQRWLQKQYYQQWRQEEYLKPCQQENDYHWYLRKVYYPQRQRYGSYEYEYDNYHHDKLEDYIEEQEKEEQEKEEQYFLYLFESTYTIQDMMDEAFQQDELQQYITETMTSEERQETWEQEHLNELQGFIESTESRLLHQNLEKYAQYLNDQLMFDELEQTMQINDMLNNDYDQQRTIK